METVPLEKLIVSQPRNKFSERRGTQKLIILYFVDRASRRNAS